MCLWLWWVESRRWGNSTQTRLWWGKEFRKFLITDRDSCLVRQAARQQHITSQSSFPYYSLQRLVSPRASWRSSKCMFSFPLQTQSILPSSACHSLYRVVRKRGAEGLTSLFHRVSALAAHVIRWGHADRVTSCSILQAINVSILLQKHHMAKKSTIFALGEVYGVYLGLIVKHLLVSDHFPFQQQLISPAEHGERNGPLVSTNSVSQTWSEGRLSARRGRDESTTTKR